MVSFSRTHYRISLRRFFARGAYRQEGPTGQRGLLASGGGFGPGGLPLGYAPGTVPPVPPRMGGRCCTVGGAIPSFPKGLRQMPPLTQFLCYHQLPYMRSRRIE